jgi:hypothetical protein
MDPDDDSQPLVNDPAREAAASMRGYWALKIFWDTGYALSERRRSNAVL